MQDRIVGRNRKASFKYDLQARFEAGIVLRGSEVKSLRSGHVGFEDAHAIIRDGEIYLRSLHIAGYDKARDGGHDPVSERKLLLKRHEIKKLETKVLEKGMLKKMNKTQIKQMINIFLDPVKSKIHGRAIFFSDIKEIDKKGGFNLELLKTDEDIGKRIIEYHMRVINHMMVTKTKKLLESDEASFAA